MGSQWEANGKSREASGKPVESQWEVSEMSVRSQWDAKKLLVAVQVHVQVHVPWHQHTHWLAAGLSFYLQSTTKHDAASRYLQNTEKQTCIQHQSEHGSPRYLPYWQGVAQPLREGWGAHKAAESPTSAAVEPLGNADI